MGCAQIDWQADALTFLIDGKVVRTVKQSDTVSKGVSRYPNTPSRIQFRCVLRWPAVMPSLTSHLTQCSLWPAGTNASTQGVIEWAGGVFTTFFFFLSCLIFFPSGLIDWNDPDYVSAGHFYSYLKKVDIKCADSPPSPDLISYVYGGNSSKSTPGITFSNLTTLGNGAFSSAGIPGTRGMGLLALFIAAFALAGHVL